MGHSASRGAGPYPGGKAYFSFFFFFFATPHGMWDLSYLTKDRTCALAVEAQNLNLWTTRKVLGEGIFLIGGTDSGQIPK